MTSLQRRDSNLDLIRVLACFMVIMVHVRLYHTYDTDGMMIPFSSFYLTAIRPCVPLFIILSGALLLPLKEPFGLFLKKRFSRVGIPAAVWMVIYAFLPVPFSLSGWSPVYAFSPSADAPLLERAFYNLTMIPVTFTGETCHFWFLYIILGLYLFMPVISPWIARMQKRDGLYFLGIWAFTLFIPYIRLAGMTQFHGQCDWNLDFGLSYYFAGYLGYLVLGCFLLRYNTLSTSKALGIGGGLFLAGWALTWMGVHAYGLEKSNAALLELFIGNLTPNVAMMTAGAFILLQKVNIPLVLRPLLNRLSQLSFGIFLVHWVIALWLTEGLHQAYPGLPAALAMPLLALTVFALSWGVTELLNLLPRKRFLLG